MRKKETKKYEDVKRTDEIQSDEESKKIFSEKAETYLKKMKNMKNKNNMKNHKIKIKTRIKGKHIKQRNT